MEDMLPQEDRTMVEQHLAQCDACSRELHSLQATTELLRNKKEALCPEPWEIYEFAVHGVHKDRDFEGHLRKCPSCAAEAQRHKADSARHAEMPEGIRAAFRTRFPQPSKSAEAGRVQSRVIDLFQWIRERSRASIMTMGAVAAAALIAVMLYPRADIEPLFGLSTTTWGITEGLVEKGTPLVTDKPKLAFLMVFRNFRHGLSQESVDAMYEGLRPTSELENKFEIVQPAAVKNAIVERGIRPEQRAELLQVFSRDLGASGLLLIEVTSVGNHYEIAGQFVDTASGRVVRSEKAQVPDQAALGAGIGSWLSLIPRL